MTYSGNNAKLSKHRGSWGEKKVGKCPANCSAFAYTINKRHAGRNQGPVNTGNYFRNFQYTILFAGAKKTSDI